MKVLCEYYLNLIWIYLVEKAEVLTNQAIVLPKSSFFDSGLYRLLIKNFTEFT